MRRSSSFPSHCLITSRRSQSSALARVTVGERLFELFPRLDVVGRLPLLDLLGDRGQFVAKLLARVLFDERPDLLGEQARVVRLIARGLAGFDATQLSLVDERLEFLVGRTPGGDSRLSNPVTRATRDPVYQSEYCAFDAMAFYYSNA